MASTHRRGIGQKSRIPEEQMVAMLRVAGRKKVGEMLRDNKVTEQTINS